MIEMKNRLKNELSMPINMHHRPYPYKIKESSYTYNIIVNLEVRVFFFK